MDQNILCQLRNFQPFAGLSDAELSAISSCLLRRALARGAYLYHPGSPGLNMYLVESGLIRVFFVNARGEEFLLNLYGPRSTLGLPLVMDDRVRMVGAAARKDSVVWALARDDMFRLMKRFPKFLLNMYLEVSDTLRWLGVFAQAQILLNLNGRVANLFLYLTRNAKGEKVDEIELPLSQSEVAGWVGGSRGRLNRALSKMQEMDLIKVRGQRIYILDRGGLARMAEDLVMDKV